MQRKRKVPKEFGINLTLTPPKHRKSEGSDSCIIHCRDGLSDPIIKFSEVSRKTVYKAAQVRKDERVISIIDESSERLSDLNHGYHRKCYQKYIHKRELEKLSRENSESDGQSVRVSSRKKDGGGNKNI